MLFLGAFSFDVKPTIDSFVYPIDAPAMPSSHKSDIVARLRAVACKQLCLSCWFPALPYLDGYSIVGIHRYWPMVGSPFQTQENSCPIRFNGINPWNWNQRKLVGCVGGFCTLSMSNFIADGLPSLPNSSRMAAPLALAKRSTMLTCWCVERIPGK